MSPDKLFDYLDGKLSTRERAELEQRLTSDQQLQRELAVARRIHASMRVDRSAAWRFRHERNSGATSSRPPCRSSGVSGDGISGGDFGNHRRRSELSLAFAFA